MGARYGHIQISGDVEKLAARRLDRTSNTAEAESGVGEKAG